MSFMADRIIFDDITKQQRKVVKKGFQGRIFMLFHFVLSCAKGVKHLVKRAQLDDEESLTLIIGKLND